MDFSVLERQMKNITILSIYNGKHDFRVHLQEINYF